MNLTKKETGTFRSFDGTHIYYEVRGEGRPVVLAYGIGCLINHWIHQIKYFSQFYRVITFDYRAHHKSDLPESRDNLNIDALAQDLSGLMDHLAIESASVWTHSFGAQVAIRAYDRFPEKFHSLIFINGFATNPIQGMFGTDAASNFFRVFKEGYHYLPETFSYLWRTTVNA